MYHFTQQQRQQFQRFFHNKNAVMNEEERRQARQLNQFLRQDAITFTPTDVQIQIMGNHILATAPNRPLLCIPIKLTHLRLAIQTYPELRSLL